jgi:hypothetical protein
MTEALASQYARRQLVLAMDLFVVRPSQPHTDNSGLSNGWPQHRQVMFR